MESITLKSRYVSSTLHFHRKDTPFYSYTHPLCVRRVCKLSQCRITSIVKSVCYTYSVSEFISLTSQAFSLTSADYSDIMSIMIKHSLLYVIGYFSISCLVEPRCCFTPVYAQHMCCDLVGSVGSREH